MEIELSSLEIGFMDIMDDVNIIPITSSNLPSILSSNHAGNGAGLCPFEPEHLLIPSLSTLTPTTPTSSSLALMQHNNSMMPYIVPMDHDVFLNKRSIMNLTSNSNTPTKKRNTTASSAHTNYNKFEDYKRQRKPQVHKKCEHNTRKSECKFCGGSQICHHKRIKSRCKDCGGSQICEHMKIRTRCKDCKSIANNICTGSMNANSAECNSMNIYNNLGTQYLNSFASLGSMHGMNSMHNMNLSGMNSMSHDGMNTVGSSSSNNTSNSSSAGYGGMSLSIDDIPNMMPLHTNINDESLDALKHIRV
jgi:hypothetical protein